MDNKTVYLCDWYGETHSIFNSSSYDTDIAQLLVDVNKEGLDGNRVGAEWISMEEFGNIGMNLATTDKEKNKE